MSPPHCFHIIHYSFSTGNKTGTIFSLYLHSHFKLSATYNKDNIKAMTQGSKGKHKFYPTRGHEVIKGEQRYSFTLYLTLALEGDGRQGGPQGQS
jgi:hypothetical protein